MAEHIADVERHELEPGPRTERHQSVERAGEQSEGAAAGQSGVQGSASDHLGPQSVLRWRFGTPPERRLDAM